MEWIQSNKGKCRTWWETCFICRTQCQFKSNRLSSHLISLFLTDEEHNGVWFLNFLKQNLMHEDSRNQTALWLAVVVMLKGIEISGREIVVDIASQWKHCMCERNILSGKESLTSPVYCSLSNIMRFPHFQKNVISLSGHREYWQSK